MILPIILPVPNPSFSDGGIGGATVYADLTCEIAVNGIPADMLINKIDVSATWTGARGNELSNTGRITVTPAELDSDTTYISTKQYIKQVACLQTAIVHCTPTVEEFSFPLYQTNLSYFELLCH